MQRIGLLLALACAAWLLPAAAHAQEPWRPVVTSCANGDGSAGCAAARNLAGAWNTTVTPDGRTAYVAAFNAAAIGVFDRDPADRGADPEAGRRGVHQRGRLVRMRGGARVRESRRDVDRPRRAPGPRVGLVGRRRRGGAHARPGHRRAVPAAGEGRVHRERGEQRVPRRAWALERRRLPPGQRRRTAPLRRRQSRRRRPELAERRALTGPGRRRVRQHPGPGRLHRRRGPLGRAPARARARRAPALRPDHDRDRRPRPRRRDGRAEPAGRRQGLPQRDPAHGLHDRAARRGRARADHERRRPARLRRDERRDGDARTRRRRLGRGAELRAGARDRRLHGRLGNPGPLLRGDQPRRARPRRVPARRRRRRRDLQPRSRDRRPRTAPGRRRVHHPRRAELRAASRAAAGRTPRSGPTAT